MTPPKTFGLPSSPNPYDEIDWCDCPIGETCTCPTDQELRDDAENTAYMEAVGK
jgi:hypothetical protein